MADGRPMVVNVEVDASSLRRELTEAEALSRRFGNALGNALEAGVVRGASLSEVLRGLASRLSSIALSAALKPVENAFGSLFSGLLKGLTAGAGGGFGPTGLAAPASLTQALSGASTQAPDRRGEAAGGAAVASVHGPVTVNISTPDADSFRRSEAQVSAALARAVARGRRGL